MLLTAGGDVDLYVWDLTKAAEKVLAGNRPNYQIIDVLINWRYQILKRIINLWYKADMPTIQIQCPYPSLLGRLIHLLLPSQ